jgi:hypothetical protein
MWLSEFNSGNYHVVGICKDGGKIVAGTYEVGHC